MPNKPTSNGGDRRWLAVLPDMPARRTSLRSFSLCGALAASLLISLSSAASASTASITDRLTTDRSALETVSLPPGTGLVKVAVMKTMTGEGIIYKTIAATQVRYVPPAGYPVVDLQAATSTGTPIGGWAGRRLTAAAETKQQIEERELKEREAREKAEREAREREEREHMSASMRVGLDAGGWDWASAVKESPVLSGTCAPATAITTATLRCNCSRATASH